MLQRAGNLHVLYSRYQTLNILKLINTLYSKNMSHTNNTSTDVTRQNILLS